MNGTTTQPNLLALAKQGNAKAIAALINRQLQPKGITAKAAFKDGCLQVMVESVQVPNQQILVEFIRKAITNISPKSIKRVKIHGKQINTISPLWSIEFEIGTGGNPTNALDKTEEKTGSSLSEPKTPEKSKEKARSKSFVLESTGNKKLDFILVTTVIALGSAILIAFGWGNSQVTAPSSFNTETQVQPTNKELSMAAYNQIVSGMSYQEVANILGKEGKELSRVEITGIPTTVMYQWEESGGLKNMNATFQDDALVSKAQFGLK